MTDNLVQILLAQNKELMVEVQRLNAKIVTISEAHYADIKAYADSFANLSINIFGHQNTEPPQQLTEDDIDQGLLGGALE